MIGILGKILINAAFLTSLLACIGYYLHSQNDEDRYYRISNWLFGLKGVFVLAASGLLLYLILNHRFEYYYVFNYTSSDLELKYLVSAFWGGQEGSFMLWIVFSFIIGLGLMKWTRKPYRGPVLFFLTLTQLFLLSMVSGISLGDSFHIGASPFRTLAQEMPNAPFIQANPDFIPAEGQGLNDLLKSPWMIIHPPILFFGFAMMTIPYCFAMAALWKQKYNEWIHPALPWTLGANVALLTAIFLGAYWAYVTLSFGGYWAWDPVENASFVPWLLGTAGIHTMVIQKKSSTSQKASIVFAILAYVAIVYETFLTRSGILSDSSVHSFVDLGLYNQLLAFMVVVTFVGLGLLVYRYRDLDKQKKESRLLSAEFMTFAGSMVLFLIGFVIAIGTSSPILGRLFEANPTPPEISFYNEWTMPLAIIAAFMTVVGQYLFWKKQDAESLASDLLWPVLISCILTLITMFAGGVRNLYYVVYILSGWFALVGNGFMMVHLARKNPKLIGGTLTHVGFGLLLLGIIASSAYNTSLLDRSVVEYNAAVEQGVVTDDQGIPVRQTVDFFQLDLNEPKVVNDKYVMTFEGYTLENQARPGQQQYRIKFEPVGREGRQFYLHPEVYPMISSSSAERIEWSVDPDVRGGLFSDIYLYVAGSSYVEQINEQVQGGGNPMQPAAMMSDSGMVHTLSLARGETESLGGFNFTFRGYQQADSSDGLVDSTVVAVRASLEVTHLATESMHEMRPLFSIYSSQGSNWTYAPPVVHPERDLVVQFSGLDPATGEVEFTIRGIEAEAPEEWVLIIAEEKPFISIVWLGTFILMGGFSISIIRHWEKEKKKKD